MFWVIRKRNSIQWKQVRSHVTSVLQINSNINYFNLHFLEIYLFLFKKKMQVEVSTKFM